MTDTPFENIDDGTAATMADDEEAAGTIEGDPQLNLLVHLAEKGVGVGLTLFVRGQTITGTLMSREQYLSETAEDLRKQDSPITAVYDELKKALDEQIGLEADGPAPDYRYVHLRKATVIAPGAKNMPDGGMMMRILRSEVSGFALGSLQASIS